MKRILLAAVCALGTAAAAWGLPDLVISSVSLSTNRAYPGDKIRIDSVTRNNGDATGWWTYCKVYYWWGTAGNKKAVKIGSGVTPNYNELNGIDKGEEEEDTISSWTVPATAAPGIYYLTCVADAEGEIAESDEGNNERSVKFTVIGTPSFSDVQWRDPRYVSAGDSVTMYGECANIAAGRTVTLRIYEDDVAGDDLVATLTTTVREANGTYYFARTWAAAWTNDASGDPEYYFTASYSQDGNTYEGTSGESDGAELHVSQDRVTPSPLKGDFYYDNDVGNGSATTGPATKRTALTDDRIPLILVHGMSGDAKPETANYWYGWVNSDAEYPLGYFNQAPMSNMFRVYRYVYDSRDFISTNGVKFAKFVNDFYASHPEFAERQVVVMAHSMGGLVSRYAMNVNTQFAARVHRLVTLGSPHLGAQGANPTWIKYSGPDDNSWFVSSIYNTFDLHNNTAGCFDLAWWDPTEIPSAARTDSAIREMGDMYNTNLLKRSLTSPFAGWAGMKSRAADNKCVCFGGSSTNRISDYLSQDWIKAASKEVSTDHLGLWVATKIYRSMSYADGTGVGDNDGLVPLISALMTDKSSHPTAVRYNLNALEGQEVDHASYLDVPVTMDSVKASLLTIAKGQCQPAGAVSAGARWQLTDNVTGETSPWQKSGVRLPALVAGRSYTVKFKPVEGFRTPGNVTFTAKKAVSSVVTGTYLEGEGNHAPSSVSLSGGSVRENEPAGTEAGRLGATDEDGDAVTFTLASGEGDEGNGYFTISGDRLLTAAVLDYETTPALSVRVRATDGGGLWTEESFTVEVEDVDETTPAERTGDGWLALRWDAVPGATDYRLDVSACTGLEAFEVPSAPLGTNAFLAGQDWRYEAPGGATTVASGSVKTAPAWFTYGTTNAHALFGTGGVALVSRDFELKGATAVALDFAHGTWNGGGDTNVSRLDAWVRWDGGAWEPLGSSTATGDRDGGEVAFFQQDVVEPPAGARTAAFMLSAPNARRDSWQRGSYVTGGTAWLYGQPDFSGSDCHLAGYPRMLNATALTIQGLPAGETYYYHLEALVDGAWTEAGYGCAVAEDDVPMPLALEVAEATSTALALEWMDPGMVDHFEVEATPVLAAGVARELSAAPNVNLGGAENVSGWGYSSNHVRVAKDWLCVISTPDSDYHGLVVRDLPGVQSPMLDLSGFGSASVWFNMRSRGVDDYEESVAAVLYYSTDGGETWTAAGSVTTNRAPVFNGRFCELAVPPEALVDGVILEVGCPGASSEGSKWSGLGVGIRNVRLEGTPAAAPDYGAATAMRLEDVPAPRANAAASEWAATATAKGLSADTTYYLRVRSVDVAGHVSAWAGTSGRTLAASAPYGLELSGRAVSEYNAPGAYIGRLSAEDADEGDELRYELASGEGDADNAWVAVDGDVLRAAGVFEARDGAVRQVRVRVTDAAGLWSERSFEIEVLAAAEPPKGVLVPGATLAAMASRAVAVEELVPGEDGVSLAWRMDAARRGARWYDVYYSTNLLEGFYFLGRTTEGAFVDQDGRAKVKFWAVLAGE